MSEALPRSIEVRESDGLVRYLLPRRALGAFGLIPMIIGLGLIGVGIATGRVVPPLDGLFFAVFVVAFPIFGAVAVLLGMNLVLGRLVVELSPDRLRASSRLLGLGWWRSQPLLRPVRVEAVRPQVEGEPPDDTSGELIAIDGPRRRRLASNYDVQVLRPLAADLNRRLAQRSPMQ